MGKVYTVVTTGNYIKTRKVKPDLYRGCVLVTPVPERGSMFENEILEAVRSGGSVVFYGPVQNAGEELLDMLNLSKVAPLEGVMDVTLNLEVDELVTGGYPYPGRINHREIISGGGIDTVLKYEDDPHTMALAVACQQGEKRIISLYRSEAGWNGGKVIWVRGTNSCRIVESDWLPSPDPREDYFRTESLIRLAVSFFGYKLYFNKRIRSSDTPVIMIHRSNNAFYFSGYARDATVSYKVALPMGAPVNIGTECWYDNGCSLYHTQRSWQNECRVFIAHAEQGVISCIEMPPVSHVMRRRFCVSGLRKATIRIFPEKCFEENTEVLLNSLPEDHLTGEPMDMEIKSDTWGRYIEARDVTGNVVVSTPFAEKVAF